MLNNSQKQHNLRLNQKEDLMRFLCVALVVCTLLEGCARDLTRNSAAERIPDSLSFTLHQKAEIILEVGIVGNPCYVGVDKGEYVLARNMGIIDIARVASGLYRVQLTPKGEQLLAETRQKPYAHRLEGKCDYEQVNLQAAKRVFENVSGITGEGSRRRVEYAWKWDMSSFGKALSSETSPYWHMTPRQRNEVDTMLCQDAHACLALSEPRSGDGAVYGGTDFVIYQKYDDGWRLMDSAE